MVQKHFTWPCTTWSSEFSTLLTNMWLLFSLSLHLGTLIWSVMACIHSPVSQVRGIPASTQLSGTLPSQVTIHGEGTTSDGLSQQACNLILHISSLGMVGPATDPGAGYWPLKAFECKNLLAGKDHYLWDWKKAAEACLGQFSIWSQCHNKTVVSGVELMNWCSYSSSQSIYTYSGSQWNYNNTLRCLGYSITFIW